MELRSGTVVNVNMSNRDTSKDNIRDRESIRVTIPNLDMSPIRGTEVGYVEDLYERDSESTGTSDEEIAAGARRESIENQNMSIISMIENLTKKMDENSKKMEERSEQNMKKMEERLERSMSKKMDENSRKMAEQNKKQFAQTQEKIEEQAEQNKQQFEQIQISLGYQFEAQDKKWESRMNDLKKTLKTVETRCDAREQANKENMEKIEHQVKRQEQDIGALREEFEEVKGEWTEKLVQINEKVDNSIQEIHKKTSLSMKNNMKDLKKDAEEAIKSKLDNFTEEIKADRDKMIVNQRKMKPEEINAYIYKRIENQKKIMKEYIERQAEQIEKRANMLIKQSVLNKHFQRKLEENSTKMVENYRKMEENSTKLEDTARKLEGNSIKMEENSRKTKENSIEREEKYIKREFKLPEEMIKKYFSSRKIDENSRKRDNMNKMMDERAEQNKQQFAELQTSINHKFEAQKEMLDPRTCDIKKSMNIAEIGCDTSERLESYVEIEEPEMETLAEEWEEVKGKEHEKEIQIHVKIDDKIQKISEDTLVILEGKSDKGERDVAEEMRNDLKKSLNIVEEEETGCDTGERVAEENMEKLESSVERDEPEMGILNEELECVNDEEHEKMIQINEEMDDKIQKVSEKPLVILDRKSDNWKRDAAEELRNDLKKSLNIVETDGDIPEGLAEENVEILETNVEGEEQEREILKREFKDAKDEGHGKMIQLEGGTEVHEMSKSLLVTVERRSDNCKINATEEFQNDLLERMQDGILEQIEIRMGEGPKKIPERNSTLCEVEKEKDMNYDEVKQSFINICLSRKKRVEVVRNLYVPNIDKDRVYREQYLLEVYYDTRQLDHPLPPPLFLLLYAS